MQLKLLHLWLILCSCLELTASYGVQQNRRQAPPPGQGSIYQKPQGYRSQQQQQQGYRPQSQAHGYPQAGYQKGPIPQPPPPPHVQQQQQQQQQQQFHLGDINYGPNVPPPPPPPASLNDVSGSTTRRKIRRNLDGTIDIKTFQSNGRLLKSCKVFPDTGYVFEDPQQPSNSNDPGFSHSRDPFAYPEDDYFDDPNYFAIPNWGNPVSGGPGPVPPPNPYPRSPYSNQYPPNGNQWPGSGVGANPQMNGGQTRGFDNNPAYDFGTSGYYPNDKGSWGNPKLDGCSSVTPPFQCYSFVDDSMNAVPRSFNPNEPLYGSNPADNYGYNSYSNYGANPNNNYQQQPQPQPHQQQQQQQQQQPGVSPDYYGYPNSNLNPNNEGYTGVAPVGGSATLGGVPQNNGGFRQVCEYDDKTIEKWFSQDNKIFKERHAYKDGRRIEKWIYDYGWFTMNWLPNGGYFEEEYNNSTGVRRRLELLSNGYKDVTDFYNDGTKRLYSYTNDDQLISQNFFDVYGSIFEEAGWKY